MKNADFVIPVEIDNVTHQVYVLKRPFVDEFLERIGDKFECVLFTASLAKVGFSLPLIDSYAISFAEKFAILISSLISTHTKV